MYVRTRSRRIEFQQRDAKKLTDHAIRKGFVPFCSTNWQISTRAVIDVMPFGKAHGVSVHAQRQKHGKKNASHASRWRNADEKQRRDCSREGDREFRVILSRFYSNKIFIWENYLAKALLIFGYNVGREKNSLNLKKLLRKLLQLFQLLSPERRYFSYFTINFLIAAFLNHYTEWQYDINECLITPLL